MHRSTKLALAAAGISLATVGAIATTSARAATSETSDTSTTTSTTATTTQNRMRLHDTERLSDMASLLGITTDQLQTELDSGKEFYQIAAAHGVTYDKVVANQKTEYQTKLDDMVKVGYITQAQADTFMKNWETRAAESPMLGLGFGGGRGHGPMGM